MDSPGIPWNEGDVLSSVTPGVVRIDTARALTDRQYIMSIHYLSSQLIRHGSSGGRAGKRSGARDTSSKLTNNNFTREEESCILVVCTMCNVVQHRCTARRPVATSDPSMCVCVACDLAVAVLAPQLGCGGRRVRSRCCVDAPTLMRKKRRKRRKRKKRRLNHDDEREELSVTLPRRDQGGPKCTTQETDNADEDPLLKGLLYMLGCCSSLQITGSSSSSSCSSSSFSEADFIFYSAPTQISQAFPVQPSQHSQLPQLHNPLPVRATREEKL
ncbi:hypothetical protein EYF80_043295 [Liparis tanakae]|uniref:Uncharacterized protein n=1 Tax=Liparis tanakae TaxID=230148 RepID=A0A4Z2FZ46_9TELE|nr:hypothetical protein EYF80_043295 [Liparis tanakae]